MSIGSAPTGNCAGEDIQNHYSFLRSHVSHVPSVRVSGTKSNPESPTQWLQQSQEILSVFDLGSPRPKLQEYVYILILKHNDNSIN